MSGELMKNGHNIEQSNGTCGLLLCTPLCSTKTFGVVHKNRPDIHLHPSICLQTPLTEHEG